MFDFVYQNGPNSVIFGGKPQSKAPRFPLIKECKSLNFLSIPLGGGGGSKNHPPPKTRQAVWNSQKNGDFQAATDRPFFGILRIKVVLVQRRQQHQAACKTSCLSLRYFPPCGRGLTLDVFSPPPPLQKTFLPPSPLLLLARGHLLRGTDGTEPLFVLRLSSYTRR